MRDVVLGTAGHIDHGKTSLVRALTGVDTDRLKEEKARGITIELGFAQLALPSGAAIGVVDVPGHERFVRTMVAGATGIDVVLFVVAADEGVMPQTREHLQICGLLGITRGVVALTKIDLVDADMLELARADLADALRGTFLESAPVVPCSTVTGEGIAALPGAIEAQLVNLAAPDDSALFRLPIDRVFSLRGFGTVVTGTLWSGQIAVDDVVAALPGAHGVSTEAKVRSIEVHGKSTPRAQAGNRTALNLPVAKEALARGEVLVRPGTLVAGDRLDVELRHLPNQPRPLRHRARLLFHHGTTQCQALVNLLDCIEIAPGATGLAQLLLDRPLATLPGDRFVLRGFRRTADHATTIGGGTILRTLGERHRRGSPALSATLLANRDANTNERVRLEIVRTGRRGIDGVGLQMRLPMGMRATERALQQLLSDRAVVRIAKDPPHYLGREARDALGEDVRAALFAWHRQRPLDPSMSKESLRSMLGDGRLLNAVLEPLLASGAIVAVDDGVRLATHDPSAAATASGLDALTQRIADALAEAGLQPPRPVDLATTLGVAAPAITAALTRLGRDARAIKIGELWFDASAVETLRQRLIARLREVPELTPSEWKELVGASRKFCIPLAEYFDAQKVTLRVGDNRRLRRV